jgi:20S proteasome subunit alpha 6
MRQQAMSSKMMLDRPVPINRLVGSIADSACLCSARAAALNSLIAWRASLVLFAEAQVNTQVYGRRPYGVGFLVVGQDVSRPDPPALPSCWQGRSLIAAALPLQDLGPHLFEFSPSGNSFEYVAMSIGARSQSAKTYLEKNFESFPEGAYAGRTLADPVGTPLLTECLLTYCIRPLAADLDTLINHGLQALRETLQQDKELTTANTSIAIVGPLMEGEPSPAHLAKARKGGFRIVEGDDVAVWLDRLEPAPPHGGFPPAAQAGAAAPAAPAEEGAQPPAAGGDGDVAMQE